MVELVPVVADDAERFVSLVAAFHAEGGHPLDDGGRAAARTIAKGHPLGRAWFIHEAGRCVGYTVLCLGFGIEYGGPDAFVDDLYLIPEARGRGLGDQAMTRLAELARDLGAKALFLVVAPDNTRAQQLYRRHHFEETSWRLMVRRL